MEYEDYLVSKSNLFTRTSGPSSVVLSELVSSGYSETPVRSSPSRAALASSRRASVCMRGARNVDDMIVSG